MTRLGIKHTLTACFVGYITQAVVNNFAPLLFVTFNTTYNISLSLIGAMITANFGVQLLVDLLASKFVDKIGYRPCAVAAHLLAGTGLVLLAVLPGILPPAVGLFLASAVYAVGGGLIEVIISPMVEACPFTAKKSVMSLLHSFYCWGQVAVVGLSTLYFVLAGIENWALLACIWAALPVLNALYFLIVPVYTPETDTSAPAPVRGLLKTRRFWFFFVLMLCAGACELSASQWASAFAEEGLGVSKTVGDLLGPCLFALMMGLSRVLYSAFGAGLSLKRTLSVAAVCCAAGYALCAFAPAAWAGLAGCAVIGFSVGVMWPGTYSYAAERVPKGGTALFALLALAGDVGCTAGPSAVGALADALGGLRTGFAFGLAFPVLMLAVLLLSRRKRAPAPETPVNAPETPVNAPAAGEFFAAEEGGAALLPAADGLTGEGGAPSSPQPPPQGPPQPPRGA